MKDSGKILISDDVLSMIAGFCAAEFDEVTGFVYGNGKKESKDVVLKKKRLTKGIQIIRKKEENIVNIHIALKRGTNIMEVASRISENVKSNILKTTDINAEVNVFVDSINID